ncbi:MAG: hypothetical protein HZB41_07840 [Ignavibacteriae bacterium]|nr:hypothetical protein [Ignavibacteriota bacterium]
MITQRKILFIILLIVANFFNGGQLFSQINVQRIVINPLNRATLYFSDYPANYATKLSDDKQKVVLMLKDASVPDSSREAHSTGIISDVYVQSFRKNLEISVILKDKRGYTSTPLVYSRAIMTEVFKWDQLSVAEDEYRTGLLALEANLTASAEKSFEKSVSLGNADASVFLGIIKLQQGRVKSAFEHLLNAYKFQMRIPDGYAALSQIMRMNGYQKEAVVLADTFYKQTGLVSFPELVVPENPELTENEKNYDSLLKELSFLITRDSSLLQAKQDSIRKDSSDNKRFKEILDSKNKNLSKKDVITQIIESLIPDGFSKVLFVFLVLFIVIFIVLVFAYFKWKKKKIEGRKKKQVSKKLIIPAKQSSAIAKKASNAYQKSGTFVDEKVGAGDDITSIEKLRKTQETKSSQFEQTFEKKLSELADRLDQPKKEILLAEKEKKYSEQTTDEVKLTAKLELALHLLEEQQKLKEKETDKITDKGINTNISKMKEVAKSLGLSKENVRAEKPQDKDNKEMISQLADKFAKEINQSD